MWGIEVGEIKAMAHARRNITYLPGANFPDELEVTTELDEALEDAEDVLIAVPSHAFRETLQRLKASRSPVRHLTCATKGFETDSVL